MESTRLERAIHLCATAAATLYPTDREQRLATFAARLAGHIQDENAPLADLVFALTHNFTTPTTTP